MTTQYHVKGSSTLKALLEDPNLINPPTIELSNDPLKVKKEDIFDLPKLNYGSAFLGPNLWDRSQDSTDFNLQYMDLDEFLSENDIPINSEDMLNDVPVGTDESSCGINVSNPMPVMPCQFSPSPHNYLTSSTSSPVDYHTSINQLNSSNCSSVISFTGNFQANEQDLTLTSSPGECGFDPQIKDFAEGELKPQPIIKKSKKIFVPEDLKDEKYWARRHKNNFAARRSRESRRVKENQIAIKAAFLEKENSCLRGEMAKLQKENAKLQEKVSKYESSLPECINLLLPQ